MFTTRRDRTENGYPRQKTLHKLFRAGLTAALVAALVFGTAGLITFEYFRNKYQTIADSFNLKQVERMEAASIIYDRAGKQFGKIFIQNRNPVAYDQFSPLLVDAVVAAEDSSFYSHKGVDWQGVLRAAITNYTSGRIAQGASTVTQQLARNSFNMRERTFERKFIEMLLAMRIEKAYSKNQIMEMYLNRVYFGSGFYGAEAAARGYFGKPAKDVNLGEAAMLAGLLRSPQAFSPWNNLEAATAVRNRVLLRMRETGKITADQYRMETESRLYVRKRTNPHKVSYAVDYIRQQVIAALGFERAANGGFHIYTTLDLNIQRTAESSLRAQLDQIERRPDYKHETYAD
ncbi:MAG TPA: transglycosylase domain-containing protein, partial [Chthoniobacterales bacterium]